MILTGYSCPIGNYKTPTKYFSVYNYTVHLFRTHTRLYIQASLNNYCTPKVTHIVQVTLALNDHYLLEEIVGKK